MRTRKIATLAAGLLTGIASLVPVATAQASTSASPSKVVLGSTMFLPHSKGFGIAAPSTIFKGGDPSGLITHITWQHWGKTTAIGWGRTYIFKPSGGFYSKQVPVELRASTVSWDAADHAQAYMLLDAKEPSRPGGALGSWFEWSGPGGMCN